MIDNPEHALLPVGMTDLLPPFAEHEEDLAARLGACFASAGYELVKPPLLEFEAALLKGIGADVAEQTFRLMDPVSHRMIGVRADLTPQIARLAWTRLNKRPRPLRVRYDGEVLRAGGTGGRQRRAFRTVGVELIGSADAAMADVEIILLATESLLNLGIDDITIDINVPSIAQSICNKLGLSPSEVEVLLAALSRKDGTAIDKITKGNSSQLLGLINSGGNAEACLAKLDDLELPDDVAALNERLKEVVSLIRTAQPALNLTVDPAETRGFEYHLGVSFAIFSTSARSELGMGGRYQSSEEEVATGFSLFMDVLTDLLPRPDQVKRLYLPFGSPPAAGVELRESGWVVIQGLVPEKDVNCEARRLLCSHFWIEGEVHESAGPQDCGGG